MTDFVDISFDEVSRYKTHICQLESVLSSSPNLFKVEFGVEGKGFDPSKETACIFLIAAPIGSHVFGIILVLTENIEENECERYRLLTK